MVLTKISKGFKITIPRSIREELNIEEVDHIDWEINEKGKIELTPKKKKSITKLIGIISDENMDALEITEKVSKGDI